MNEKEYLERQAINSKNPGRLIKIGHVVAPQCERPKVTACHLWQQEQCPCTPVSGCQNLDAAPVVQPMPAVFRTRSKYKNVKTGKYASKKESKRAAELKALEAGGFISELKEQVPFLLVPPQKDAAGKSLERSCTYQADFTYLEGGKLIVEDVKGVLTEVFRVKRKLLLFVHGLTIRIT